MTETVSSDYTFRGRESWRDPWDAYRRLRDHDPVHHVPAGRFPEMGEFWVLSHFADVFRAARDTTTFSSAQGLTPGDNAMEMFEGRAAPIVMLDPPDHTQMRRLVSRPMTPRKVANSAPAVRDFVDQRFDEMLSANPDTADIVGGVYKPLASFVVAEYLGVPEVDRMRFDGWTNAIVAANADGDIAGAPNAALELFGFAEELIERRKVDPGDDLVSDLVQAGDESVSAEWIVGFIFTMVAGGNDTTAGLLGGTAELLTTDRQQRQLLIDDPTRIAGSIDEFLRLTSPVQNLARTTTEPVEIQGVKIPADKKVMLLYGSANRDEREFGDDAADLNVLRGVENPLRMLSLGSGAHHCLGAAAARLQGTVVLERTLARFPEFEVDYEAGEFAPGPFVRRYERLPFSPNS